MKLLRVADVDNLGDSGTLSVGCRDGKAPEAEVEAKVICGVINNDV